jgi:hypothetical protein
MTKIYSTAERVLVWLGHDLQWTNWHSYGEQVRHDFDEARRLATDHSHVKRVLKDERDGRTSAIDSLKWISSCGWFSRMWT